MVDSSNEVKEKILTGKQALSNDYIDLAIQAFQEALNVEGSSHNSLFGIAQAYLLLASGIKGVQDDKNTAIQITEAVNLLPSETDQVKAYISLLIAIGKGLQEISFFESSIAVYKKSLQYAQTQAAKGDLKTISTISWYLAFSYQKLGQIEPGAKLYRIAADLEQNPEDAITLYRSSANQYYQTGMRDEALNILQTAFDKAGILQQIELQNEIACFQGIIAFEIYKTRKPSDLASPVIEYLDLALEKFEIVNDSEWLTRIENERMLLSTQTKAEIYNPEKIIQPDEDRSTVDLPISRTIKDPTGTSVTPVENSSPISKEMREFLDESTRTLDNLGKLSSETIKSEEEIEELHEADFALSENTTSGKFESINPYDRLFSSPKISSKEPIASNIQINDSTIPAIEQETPIIGVPKLSEVSNRLQQAGWVVITNDLSNKAKNPEPDIIAEKGLVRKKRKMIFFAEDETDAEICSFLLQSNATQGEKFVFLLSGNPKKVKISKKVKLVNRVDQLFSASN